MDEKGEERLRLRVLAVAKMQELKQKQLEEK